MVMKFKSSTAHSAKMTQSMGQLTIVLVFELAVGAIRVATKALVGPLQSHVRIAGAKLRANFQHRIATHAVPCSPQVAPVGQRLPVLKAADVEGLRGALG